MKKLLLVAIVGVMIFVGCKKDEEAITKIEFAEGEVINMSIGESLALHIKVFPENLRPHKNYTWKTSPTGIVVVNITSYNMQAIAEGETIVTASLDDLTASCRVIVSPIAITEIKLDKTDYEILIGESMQLNPTITPSDATYANKLDYSSTNTTVAKVNNYGKIETVGVGECQIKIASPDGKVSMTCNIKVLPIEVTKINLNRSEWPIEKGDTYQFSFWVEPENATDKTVKWSSSNNSIVTIAEDGTFTGVGIGECTITAISSKAEVKADCKVTVNPVSVKGVSISQIETKALIGSEIFLQAYVTPTNAVNQKIIWTSSNPYVATVDSNGVVNCLSNGNAVITATSEEGGFSKSCSVTIGSIDIFMSAKHGVIGTAFTVGGSFDSMNYEITNSSNVEVVVKTASINGVNVSVMRTIQSGQTLSDNLKGYFSSTGTPVVTWTIEYNGAEYIINSTYIQLLGLVK